jgi:hypothetical protein
MYSQICHIDLATIGGLQLEHGVMFQYLTVGKDVLTVVKGLTSSCGRNLLLSLMFS